MKTLSLTPAAAPLSSAPLVGAPAGSPRRQLRALHRRNPVLFWAGSLNVPLIVLALVLLPLDHRLVTGLHVWFKPLKFAASSLLYLWTLGWLLADLPAGAQRAGRRISWVVAVSLSVEILAVYVQAFRGTTSHFNTASAFDGLVFGIMGLFILLNTLALVWALGLAVRFRPVGPAAYAWGLRLGLGLFLVGSAIGGSMIHNMGHTVGGPDGGPGLPGLGWSTRYGDLRAAHFLGLHALQALPLVGRLLAQYFPRPRPQLAALAVFTLLYIGAVAWLYWHALQGLPLLAGR